MRCRFGDGRIDGDARQQPPAAERWITAWGTSQNGLGMNTVTNTTVRMIARVTVSGEAVRIRLDNTFGTAPLTVGQGVRGTPDSGGGARDGSNRQVFFNTSAQRDRSRRWHRHERSGDG